MRNQVINLAIGYVTVPLFWISFHLIGQLLNCFLRRKHVHSNRFKKLKTTINNDHFPVCVFLKERSRTYIHLVFISFSASHYVSWRGSSSGRWIKSRRAHYTNLADSWPPPRNKAQSFTRRVIDQRPRSRPPLRKRGRPDNSRRTARRRRTKPHNIPAADIRHPTTDIDS